MTSHDLVPPRPDLVPDEVTNPPTTSSLVPLSKRGRGRGGDVERKTEKTRNLNPSDFLINSIAKLTLCKICKGWIYEAQLYGFKTKVEPTPLNSSEEVIHRLEGRRVFQTLRKGYDWELSERTAWHITKGDPTAVVLPEHSCKTPVIFEPTPIFPMPVSKGIEF